jgi:nucleoside-diphosphate-sugar epimerase
MHCPVSRNNATAFCLGFTALLLLEALGFRQLSSVLGAPYCAKGASGGVGAATAHDGSHQRQQPPQQQRVLLTGGLGFIGSHVVELLLSRGYYVVVYDNGVTGHNHNPDTDRELMSDVRHVKELEAIGAGCCDFVIHLAAAISVAESMKLPEKYTDNNVHGSQNVIDWAVKHRVRRMVAASSAAVYGNPDASKLPIRESEPYAGLSPYADSKYKMEGLMRKAYDEQGLPCTALRFFNVFGPRQDPKSEYVLPCMQWSHLFALMCYDAARSHPPPNIYLFICERVCRWQIHRGDLNLPRPGSCTICLL